MEQEIAHKLLIGKRVNDIFFRSIASHWNASRRRLYIFQSSHWNALRNRNRKEIVSKLITGKQTCFPMDNLRSIFLLGAYGDPPDIEKEDNKVT